MVETLGVAFAAITALGIAAQAIFVRIGTDSGRSNDAVLFVFLMNLVLLVPLSLAVSYPNYHLTPVSVVVFIAAGSLSLLLGRALLFAGIQRIGASRADSLKASTPLHATLFAVLLLGETVTTTHLLGILLVALGVALVSWESSRGTGPGTGEVSWFGLALPLLAAVSFASEPIFAKIGFAEGTPFLVGMSIKIVAATATFAGYLWWTDQLPTDELVSGNLRWYLAAGVASSITMVSYYAGLDIAPVAIVIPIVQSSPLFVALLSIVFLQRLERVTPRLVVAASIVVVGAALVSLAS